MKYLRIAFLTFILTFCVIPFVNNTEAYASDRGDYVKVGLKYGSTSVASATIQSDSGFILGFANDRNFEEGMPLPAYTKLFISNENGNIVIKDEEGVLLSSDLGSSGCIMTADYIDGGVLFLDGTQYRDGIMLISKSDGTMTAINYLTLEHYAYGVLNSELNYTNPLEALKAQAVAARSFGELNLLKHSADGFDLCTTTHCQVYKGYTGEYPSTNKAVDETEGEMIRYNGEPVTAFYFKNSGGHTQNAEDVWAYSQPYLKSVKDEYCPSYPWNTELSFDSIRTKLEVAGFKPGTINSISISGRNDTGAVSELKIEGSDATVYLKKEKIRNILGSTIIKSNMFQLTSSTTENGSSSWKISNGSETASYSSETYVIDGNGTVKILDAAGVYASNGTTTEKLVDLTTSETVTGSMVHISGYGYGHGVGMPQDSAVEMAKQGFTYEEILKYYYTDIEVQ